jgi:hypothetical protein
VRVRGGVALLALTGCTGVFSPLPVEAVVATGQPLAELAHPRGTFSDAAVTATSTPSWLGGPAAAPWVELDVRYQRQGVLETMRVRFTVHGREPCEVSVDVISDSGPPPVLLDNPIASRAVGRELCRALDGDASDGMDGERGGRRR